MENKKIVDKIPDQESLLERFSFIDNQILRTNLAIAFRYITFLIVVESEFGLPGVISYSIYKDIIFYTASIVESCVHFSVKKYLDKSVIKSTEIMPFEWEFKNQKLLHKISEDEAVYGAVKYKYFERFKNNTQFKTLNEAALKADILTQELFEKADALRVKRNKIHMAGLDNVDDAYDKKDINKAFSDAKDVIDNIETKLSKL